MSYYKRRLYRRYRPKSRRRSIFRKRRFRRYYRRSMVERKFKDETAGWVALPSAAWVIMPINTMQKGPDQGQRIGWKITVKSIYISLYFSTDAQNTSNQEMIRVMLVKDRETNGVMPVDSDIFEWPNYTDTMLNIINGARFRVMKDINFALSPSSHPRARVIKIKFPRVNIPTRYNEGDNGDVSDIQNNGLFIVMASNQASYMANYAIYTRIRYTDN